MRGYVLHHDSKLWSNGVRADFYKNDPYVWFTPFMWSFCHMNQCAAKAPDALVWATHNEENVIVCDLVFIVEKRIPFHEALLTFGLQDHGLAYNHFCRGIDAHHDRLEDGGFTYLADMKKSFIPHPPVPIAQFIDEERLREWEEVTRGRRSRPVPLDRVFRWRTPVIRLNKIEQLIAQIDEAAESKLNGLEGGGPERPSKRGGWGDGWARKSR